jgi:hypothetical protein
MRSALWDNPLLKQGVLRAVFAQKLLAAKKMLRSTQDPAAAQAGALRELLEANKDTTYGRRHRFAELDSPAAFQDAVPLADYEDLRPLIDAVADGSDPHALTADDVIAFSTSSGTTTGRPKLVPITKGAVRKESRVKEAFGAYLVQEHPEVLKGRWLYLFNRIDVGHTPTGLTYGSNAGYMYVTTPAIFKRSTFALPYEICLIEDYASRYYTILRMGLDTDLSHLICINPFSSLLIARLVDTWKDDLLRDLHDGGLKRDLEIAPEQRAFFERLLPARPEQARALRAAAERKGRLEPLDYWPNLSVNSSWKTGHSQFFARQISDFYPGVTVREIGYGSSEFRTGLIVSGDGSRNIPVPDNYFYEFVPLDDAEEYLAGRKRPLLLHEVEQGGKYHLVQSGIHGLVRYLVQDIVAINGRYGQTPTLEFVQKASSHTSVADEKLYEFEISDAVVALAAREPELEPRFFVAYADADGGRYRVAAEFEAQPGEDARDRFAALFDESLRRGNAGYDAARASGRLAAPELHVLEPGRGDLYVQWVSERALYDMQAKIHRLKADYRDDFAHFDIALAAV